jgi:uncharacterized protein (TIGR03435 family)
MWPAMAAIGFLLAYAAHAAAPQSAQQAADKHVTFDAASVKPSASLPAAGGEGFTIGRKQPGGRRSGGPGTGDPGRIHYPRTNLKDLLAEGYDMPRFQVQGPNWLDEERFDIDATMPPETTKAQFHIMLQNLIVERFKMAMRRETKEIPGYALVVAKNGPKLKRSTESGAPKSYDAPEKRAAATDNYDFPIVSPNAIAGHPAMTFWKEYGFRMYAEQQTMYALASELQNPLQQPVTDATGLTAKYDFTLTFTLEYDAGTPAPPGLEKTPDLFVALATQLGLRLEPKKIPAGVLVIDHIEKVPIGN